MGRSLPATAILTMSTLAAGKYSPSVLAVTDF
jgi:hypothetical protein